MSFSSQIKEILCKTQYECPACRLAELAGFFACAGKNNCGEVRFSLTNKAMTDRVLSSLESELGIKPFYDRRRVVIGGNDYKKLYDEISGDVTIYECCKILY